MSKKTNALLTIFYAVGLGGTLSLSIKAQTLMDGLFYPKTAHHILEVKKNQPVYIQLTPQSVDQVLTYYLKLSEKAPWKLTYPQKKEMDAWVSALQKSQNPPVFMLNLYNSKSKLNYHLTLGAVYHASSPPEQTIVTLYKANRPFGR